MKRIADPRGPAGERLLLVSHALCPYVQRVDITLREKGIAFERRDVSLARKPAWFRRLSPLGRVPLLVVDSTNILFESDAIAGWIDETHPPPLLPADPLARARERGWTAFASSMLDGIARLYNAPEAASFAAALAPLRARVDRIQSELGDAPWFTGSRFGLVDAAFGPVFRYFDVIDAALDRPITDGAPRVAGWRTRLAARDSVARAVRADYSARLAEFIRARGSHLARRLGDGGAQPARGTG